MKRKFMRRREIAVATAVCLAVTAFGGYNSVENTGKAADDSASAAEAEVRTVNLNIQQEDGSYSIAGLSNSDSLDIDLSAVLFTKSGQQPEGADADMVSTDVVEEQDDWNMITQSGSSFEAEWIGSRTADAGQTGWIKINRITDNSDNVSYEQVSAMLVEKESGTVFAYGCAISSAVTGLALLTIPDTIESGNYILYLFAENVSELYASNLVSVELEIAQSSLTTANPVTPSGVSTDVPAESASPEPTAAGDVSAAVSASSEPAATADVSATETPAASAAPKKGDTVTKNGLDYVVGSSNKVSFDGIAEGETKSTVTVPDAITVNGKSYKVTAISAGALKNNTKIKKLKMGANIAKVGKGACKGCVNLKTVKFSDATEVLKAESFSGCEKLQDAKLPDTIQRVGKRAFKNCKSIQSITVGATPSNAKSGAVPDTEIQQEEVESYSTLNLSISIGSNAFKNCSSLKKVIVNSAVRVIGNSAFVNCRKLSSIIVRSLVLKSVGKKALTGVSNCKISVPEKKYKPYRVLFKNKGQGKKVLVAKA
ncbi:MAG: leucine-rich repeat protein [Clostridiaceae bacterium]|nr:leucine-rich repeat protein [Clostridiaceae bacterium]